MKRLKILTVSAIIVSVLVFAGNRYYWKHFAGGDDVHGPVSIQIFFGGVVLADLTVEPGSEDEAAILSHLRHSATLGGEMSFVTYAPNVVISADTISLNCSESQVVIAKRKGPGEVQRQRVVTASSGDKLLVALALRIAGLVDKQTGAASSD